MLIRSQYEYFIYTLPAHHPSIHLSTLVVVPPGLDTARLTGLIAFNQGYVLCVYELLDFQQGRIVEYRYEVTQHIPPSPESALPDAIEYCRTSYPHKEKLYWYDSWPHPNDPSLASTFPHHKHTPPNIKHNRIPAPGLSFVQPNLPFLIKEVEQGLLGI